MSTRESRDSAGFTQREYQLLVGALKSLKNELQVDYPKLAQQCGFKNANSAKASWCGLRKKLEKMDGGNSTGSADSPLPEDADGDGAAKGVKRKKSDTSGGEDDEAGSAPAPRKSKKAPAKASKISKAKEEDGESEDDTKVVKSEGEIEKDN